MAIQSDEYKTRHEDKLTSQSPKFDTDRQVLGFIYKCKTNTMYLTVLGGVMNVNPILLLEEQLEVEC